MKDDDTGDGQEHEGEPPAPAAPPRPFTFGSLGDGSAWAHFVPLHDALGPGFTRELVLRTHWDCEEPPGEGWIRSGPRTRTLRETDARGGE